ncbi:MAG: GNAT family N-acetyltransferase [Saprospiraceae bacterium]|nr:GNAT family N-acetyltransferase [Saprospiraceae bacterium]
MAQFYQHFDYTFEMEKQSLIVENFLQNPHFGSLWLIIFEEKIVGYLALTYGFTFEFGGKDAFIDELFVEENYRNKGLGAEAICFIQSKMTDLGLNALHLQVEKYNQNAYKLYENLDFKDLKRETMTFHA